MGEEILNNKQFMISTDGKNFKQLHSPEEIISQEKECEEILGEKSGCIEIELTPQNVEIFKKLFWELNLKAKRYKYTRIGLRAKKGRIRKKNFKKAIAADMELKTGKKVSTKRIKIH